MTSIAIKGLNVTEIFRSLEGEGPLAGIPTMFVRLFGCNFTCSGFDDGQARQATIEMFDKVDGAELPKPNWGCDSAYSWHPSMKHHMKRMSFNAIFDRIEELDRGAAVPFKVLSITGGEPMLQNHNLVEFLELFNERFSDRIILIETNASIPLKDPSRWTYNLTNVMFAASPKLANSGEAKDLRIRYDVIAQYSEIGSIYLKFVTDGSNESLAEIKEWLSNAAKSEYSEALAGLSQCVYLMPEGGTAKVHAANLLRVAEVALEHGYSLAPRLHLMLYGDKTGV